MLVGAPGSVCVMGSTARRLVRPFVHLGVAGLVVLVASACATPLGWGSFSESGCPGETFSLVAAFVPAYDYAELRMTQGQGEAFTVETTAGAKCRGAKDVKACEARLGDLRSTKGFSNGSHGRMPGHRYIVATRGDEVVVVDGTTKTVGQALAPIDSPAKAALVASVATGIAPACKSSVRRVGSAYEVFLNSDSCFGPVKELMRVEPDGRTRSVERVTKPSSCVGEAPHRPTTRDPARDPRAS